MLGRDENLAVILYCLLKPRAQQRPIVSDVKQLHTNVESAQLHKLAVV